MAATPLSQQAFENELQNSDQPTLVDFYATWCGPCRAISPVIKQLAETYRGRAKVVKVDIDDHPGLASRFGVQGVPTVMVFHRGRVVQTLVGAQPATKYQAALERALGDE